MCDTNILKENEANWWFGVLQNLELIKKWKYDFFNDNFTRADIKVRLYLIDFKFPAKHTGCHFSLISDNYLNCYPLWRNSKKY